MEQEPAESTNQRSMGARQSEKKNSHTAAAEAGAASASMKQGEGGASVEAEHSAVVVRIQHQHTRRSQDCTEFPASASESCPDQSRNNAEGNEGNIPANQLESMSEEVTSPEKIEGPLVHHIERQQCRRQLITSLSSKKKGNHIVCYAK